MPLPIFLFLLEDILLEYAHRTKFRTIGVNTYFWDKYLGIGSCCTQTVIPLVAVFRGYIQCLLVRVCGCMCAPGPAHLYPSSSEPVNGVLHVEVGGRQQEEPCLLGMSREVAEAATACMQPSCMHPSRASGHVRASKGHSKASVCLGNQEANGDDANDATAAG